MNPTEQAHQNLRQVLLTGRILVNGTPMTANELSGIIQGEQMLYEKASRFDKEKEKEKAPKEPEKKE